MHRQSTITCPHCGHSDLFEGGSGNDTAEVNGGNGAETFTVMAEGARVQFDRVDPAPFTIDIGTTENLVLNANGGDDVISASGDLATLITLTIDGGSGNDTIGGGNGSDVLLGGDGNDFIDGNQGDDVAQLGAGDDTFQWDPGDGSDVVEGQDGFDTLRFNGSGVNETIDISANGGRVEFFRDVATVTMDLNDVQRIEFNAGGGADNIRIHDLGGTDAQEVAINLSGTVGGSGGDGQVDTVSIDATNGDDVITLTNVNGVITVSGLAADITITNFDANDQIVVNGLAGDDVIEASGLSGMLLTADGSDGDDVLIGSVGDDILHGGAGDDGKRPVGAALRRATVA
jgi:Ca2+-binding RTX toxin-like protein